MEYNLYPLGESRSYWYISLGGSIFWNALFGYLTSTYTVSLKPQLNNIVDSDIGYNVGSTQNITFNLCRSFFNESTSPECVVGIEV